MAENTYLCIDLKSFYASVECVQRGFDPMTTNLAVADPSRGEGTICLAISPSLKALGVKNRCRVYQIPKQIDYIMAPPRMKLYLKYSADIYAVYLKYIAKEDIHVYSIDEAFLDVTHYLSFYHMTAKELAVQIMADIKQTTGITATAGIGTNLYLAKVALDLTAKHSADQIGFLDEALYRQTLWQHRPLTDFWRIGSGIANRLKGLGITTMEELAHADKAILNRQFGIDAELLLDHAWGRECVTMADIKSYRPQSKSLSNGQTFLRDYSFEEAKLIVREMTDALCLELVQKNLLANSVTLSVGYANPFHAAPSVGTASLTEACNEYSVIEPKVSAVYTRIADQKKMIRKLQISCSVQPQNEYQQYQLFAEDAKFQREHNLQQAILQIKRKYGKNALVRGTNLLEGSTARARNQQIGGHRE